MQTITAEPSLATPPEIIGAAHEAAILAAAELGRDGNGRTVAA
jgi:hypothetical protein